MLPCLRGPDGPRNVQLIGERVVDRIDVRIGDQLFVRSVSRRDAERIRSLLCFREIARSNRCNGGVLAPLHGRQDLLEADVGCAQNSPAKLPVYFEMITPAWRPLV